MKRLLWMTHSWPTQHYFIAEEWTTQHWVVNMWVGNQNDHLVCFYWTFPVQRAELPHLPWTLMKTAVSHLKSRCNVFMTQLWVMTHDPLTYTGFPSAHEKQASYLTHATVLWRWKFQFFKVPPPAKSCIFSFYYVFGAYQWKIWCVFFIQLFSEAFWRFLHTKVALRLPH